MKSVLSIQASYDWCAWKASQSGSNFYRSFSLLRTDQRNAMLALYVFARIVDDLGDSNAPIDKMNNFQVLDRIHPWIESLSQTTTQQVNALEPVRCALADAVCRYSIPQQYLHELVRGVQQDTQGPVDIADWQSLRQYCYRVASTVGLSCLHIWKADLERAELPAIECGIAFQLTNILRDLRVDAQHGRVYLAREDREANRVMYKEWLEGRLTGDWNSLLELYFQRAMHAYESGWQVRESLTNDGRRMFELMFRTYHRLLIRLYRQRDHLWNSSVRLSKVEKLGLFLSHSLSPLYSQLKRPCFRLSDFNNKRSSRP